MEEKEERLSKKLSATARRTFELIGLAANAVFHTDGGVLEFADDEGYTACIPVTSAATLTAPADSSDTSEEEGAAS